MTLAVWWINTINKRPTINIEQRAIAFSSLMQFVFLVG